MKLIIILASVFLERMAQSPKSSRRFDWFLRLAGKMRSRLTASLWDGPLGVIVVLLPVLLPVALISIAIEGVGYGFLELLFGIVVLFMSFGPRDLDGEVDEFINSWENGDNERAQAVAADLIGGEPPADNYTLAQQISEGILVEANERFVAVMFWFLLLDPVGAALYRLACVLRDEAMTGDASGFGDSARRLHDILAWIPAQLCAFGYAITGSFVDALHHWRDAADELRGDWQASVRGVPVAAGMGALHLDTGHGLDEEHVDMERRAVADQVSAVIALVWRMLIMWVAVLALATLSGWLV